MTLLPDAKTNMRICWIFRICSKKPSHFIFLVFVLVAFAMYFFPSSFKKNFSLFQEPWEESLAPNYDTCKDIVAVLLRNFVDEGPKSSKIFSWKTPRFSDLILNSMKSDVNGDQEKMLLDALCHQYSSDSTKIDSEIDLTKIKEGHLSLTSVKNTQFIAALDKTRTVVGENITLFILAKDKDGGLSAAGGGDFFKIRAENLATKSSVAASSIVDQGNGSYIVNIPTYWGGRHDIKVFFGQSGHFVDLVKRFTSQFYAIESRFYGEYLSKHRDKHLNGISDANPIAKRELCHINAKYLNASKKHCNYNASRGEEWFCEKTGLFTACDDLYAVYSKRRTNSMKLFELFPVHDRGTLQRQTLKGFPSYVDVVQSTKKERRDETLPTCGPKLVTPHPSGYWFNGMWKSRVCNNFHYSLDQNRKTECLRNRTFYFIGDSTARQWFEYFIDPPDSSVFDNVKFGKHPFKADEKSTFTDVWEPRMAVIEDINTTVYYRSHGQPLQNGGLYSATTFVSVQLDRIPPLPDGGSQLTIVLALGPHFFLYNPDVYLNRIEATKRAALRLLSRNPKSTVIFKGTNTFIRGIGIGECCLSDWISYRQHKIAKHVFDGTPIVYLDVWDMTVSHNSEDLVHPVSEVITNEIDMALSFTCLRRN